MPREFVEKRRHKRVPLDLLYFITLKLEDGSEVGMQLVDCGRGGLQLGFPADKEPACGLLSRRVTVLGLPQALNPDGLGIPGAVVWVSAGRCGLRFDAPLRLSDEALHAFARNL
jgi:hypothetical protein